MFCNFITITRTFIIDLDKKTESFRRLELQSFSNVLTEIFRSRTRLDLELLAALIWEIDLMHDLSLTVMDRVHLNLVWWVFPSSIPVIIIYIHI